MLERQISSIRNQTSRDWRCHVGIDGVDLEAAELLRELVAEDERFVIHDFPDNVGFYRNFERLLAGVDTDSPWIALADQDDYWYPEKIERLLSTLAIDSVKLVSGQAKLTSPDGVASGITQRRARGLSSLLLDNQVTGSFSVLASEVLVSALPFPEPTDVAYHDHWLGVVAACLGDVVIVDEVLQDYVQHGGNVIGEQAGESNIANRLTSLSARSNGFRNSVRYVSHHRWGWRVEMARLCLERIPLLDDGNRRVLETFADGRLTFALLKAVIHGIVKRDVRPLRGLALLAGAIVA